MEEPVGVATGYGAGSSSPNRDKNFLYDVHTSFGAHAASCPIGTLVFFSEGGGGGAEQLPPTGAEVKKT
jgi:hypothetical protein